MSAPATKSDSVQHVEKATQAEVISTMTSKMRTSVRSTAGKGQLRNAILTHVTEERYEKAISDLEQALNSKPQYPDFKARSERLGNYSVELIKAIQAKRNFPGWSALHMSKQKELFERALLHFEDLKVTLEKIEAIESEVRMEDLRSTVWVMKAVSFAVCGLLIFALLRELTNGVFPSAAVVLDSATASMIDLVFDKFNL
jgi:tetratricopeptide (TPR) repeat protein